MQVIVVTGIELGWDCVCGVYKDKESLYDNWVNLNGDAEYQEMPDGFDFQEWARENSYVLHYFDVE